MLRTVSWLVAGACAACAARRPEPAGAPAMPVPLPSAITDVADVPFVSNLTAAPSGDRLAWVVNHRGRRNVWLASAPAYQPRPVTAFDRDDGQLISALTFSHDGSRLAFVRGGPENQIEAHPNAGSDPRGMTQDVWTASTAGGRAIRIGEGTSPTLSPDGAEVAFVHEDSDDVRDVWLAPAGGGSARPIVKLQGSEGELEWSPDGARIAFVSDRGSHSLVGVYQRAAGTVTWMGSAAATSYDLTWSPDGARVAFVRFPARLKVEPRVREGVWFDSMRVSTVVADAATGDARAVETPEPFGGYTQWGQNRPVAWAGDRVVFASERDGWIRIYAAPAAGGGAATALSPPGCESEIGDVAPDGTHVFFTANCGDPERRHLWKAPVAGGPAVALTSGTSLQWQPVVLDGGRTVAVIDAGATTPPWPALVSADGGAPRRLDGAPELAAKLVEPEVVRIPLPGTDVVLTGQLFRPAGPARQAVLYVHGGPVRQMLSGWHPMEFYHHSYVLSQRLAASGRIVLQLNYRLGTGYGRAFRLPKGAGPYGATELADVLAARDYLAALDGVEHVVLWGASYGGFLTGLALGTASDRFAGGVSVCGVSSWSNRTSPHPEDAPLIAKWAPINHVDGWTAPVLLIHGDDDRNVSVKDSIELAARLEERGRADVELVLVPDEDHFFLRAVSWELLTRRSIEFFDRLLPAR